ncbi:jg8595 [Pararge aegeria aegeria]|uniref:Jg8595 protein n=1 Tax=Pararge aegeria aegeria TaxID=348720 RepID=A0A8S4QX28_9NEOP|nr:jg8595 [Pararge aegeria aegeria]
MVDTDLVDPQQSGQTTSRESLGAAGNKRSGTVDFRTPYKKLCTAVTCKDKEQSVEFPVVFFLVESVSERPDA